MQELIDLTRELAAIPSHEDETAAGDRIEQWLHSQTDGTVRRDDHGNVIARRGTGEITLALVGHHDVVPPDDPQTASGEYVIEKRDGRLYGRGTADMKGAVAAAMIAFRDVSLSDWLELVFVSFVGEEIGGEGARAAIDDGFAPEYAVVGEGSTGYSAPGVTDVAVAHKGRRASTITAAGKSAHASEPDAGENAIYRGTDAVGILRELDTPESTVLGQTVRGSVVVTEIRGGSAWNVIPDECTITVDERTVPGDRAAVSNVESVPGVSVTVDQDLPPMACDQSAFADLVLEVAAHEQDQTPQQVIKPHATDAGWLSQAGTTCLVCGPAEPGEAHTESESVSTAVLDRCYRIYRRVAEQFEPELRD